MDFARVHFHINSNMSRLTIEVKHDIGDIVYLTTDEEQLKYQILGYNVRRFETLYELYSKTGGSYYAFDYEITIEKDVTV